MIHKTNFQSPKRFFIIMILISTMLILSGCEFNFDPQQLLNQVVSQIVPPPSATELPLQITSSPEVSVTTSPEITEEPESIGPTELIFWVPPQFDPNSGTPAGKLLNDRIKQFESENQDIFVSIRVKAASGPTGLLEALTITNNAAAEAMPSLIALSRADLEVAVTRKLVVPFDPFSTTIDGEDWYKYSRNLTLIEGSSYGLPFAGDALMLLYRPAIIGNSPKNWSDILSRGEALAFPAADPQALMALTIYSSLQNKGENPVLTSQFDEEILSNTFQIFIDGSKSGTFPLWVTQFQKDSEAWTSYNELRSNWVITWSSRYLQNVQNDTSAVSFPQINEFPFTYADGWVWAIADPRQSIQPVSAALAEFLSAPEFLAAWAPAAGVLPVRPSSLQGWQDQNLSVLLGQVALSARVKPRNENIGTIGPIIEDQLIQVLTGKVTSDIAAQIVIEKLGNP